MLFQVISRSFGKGSVDKIKNSQLYQNYSAKHGSQNVELKLREIKRSETTRKSTEEDINDVTVLPEIHMKVVMTYTPEKYTFDYNISNFYRGCWPIEKANSPMFPGIKKYLEFQDGKCAALYENKNLFVSDQTGKITTIKDVCENIEDISVSWWKGIFIISKADGRIFSGIELDALSEITV